MADLKTRYHFQSTTPYSLHDMRIDKMELKGNDLHLHFEDGFVKKWEPYERVEGSITIEKLDLDFCDVQLLSRLGSFGRFMGEKLNLALFLRRNPSFSFEVVDELYEYNKLIYAGYLWLPGRAPTRAVELSLYFWGDIVYDTVE